MIQQYLFRMFFLSYLITFLNIFGKIDTTMKSYLFEKLAEDDVKFSQTMYVTSALSLISCCSTCKDTAGCGLLNYNRLSVDNNCELIRSGLNDTVVVAQQGWNIYYGTEVSASCSDGWTHVGSSCYRVENETLTWSDAQARCAEHTNGHLVHISNVAENELMKEMYQLKLPNGFGFIWIGLNDLDVIGTHKWTDGSALSPADYVNWGEGQDGANGEQCIALYRAQDYNWHDFDCEDTLFSVCEIDII